jgi:quercetin dioxygenase-like cupin family protein
MKGVPQDNGAKHDGSDVERRKRFALRTASGQRLELKRTDLRRHANSVSGQEFIQVRVKIAPGAPFVKHMQPGEENFYVLEGLVEYQIEDKPPVMYQAEGFTQNLAGIEAAELHQVRGSDRPVNHLFQLRNVGC